MHRSEDCVQRETSLLAVVGPMEDALTAPGRESTCTKNHSSSTPMPHATLYLFAPSQLHRGQP